MQNLLAACARATQLTKLTLLPSHYPDGGSACHPLPLPVYLIPSSYTPSQGTLTTTGAKALIPLAPTLQRLTCTLDGSADYELLTHLAQLTHLSSLHFVPNPTAPIPAPMKVTTGLDLLQKQLVELSIGLPKSCDEVFGSNGVLSRLYRLEKLHLG